MHDTAPKHEDPGPGYTQEDWDEVSDNPKLTAEEIAAMRPASEVPEVYNLLPKRGRPKLPNAKVNLTLRIDPQVLEGYRATGEGWQVRMHDALAAACPMRVIAVAEGFVHAQGVSHDGTGRSLADRHSRAQRTAKAKADREARERSRPKSA